jgi:HEAT repeat protein
MADVRELSERAPFVFRGHVLTVIPTTANTTPGTRGEFIAKIQVDRWYRGKGPTETSLRFAYSGEIFRDGHDCIDFRPETYWTVFAAEKNGQLEMIDDCEGALTISPLLGPDLGKSDWLAQMEADFLAGLNDQDSAARLASIQRLGGLKLPSSRDALHRVVENGDDSDSKWAVYAALRTGDVTVLPKVKQLLADGDRELPGGAIALQLRYVTDAAALPDLLAILGSAASDLTRSCVLIALGENLKDPRAVPVIAAHLSDTAVQARYDALVGLKNITHEEACTLPREWKEQDVEPQISRCKGWWEQVGKSRNWTQN